jgi:glycosyltransferase involved in cell wall biosynthesis
MRSHPFDAHGESRPTVSAIIPSYNRTQYLAASIASVVDQTYPDWELVIADDGSGAETRAYLRGLAHPNIRVIELPHCGNPARVRNAAIAAARGRYVAFQDSDDIWKPRKLELQIAALAAQNAARWTFADRDRVDSDGRPLEDARRAHPVLRDGWIFAPLLRLDFAAAMPTVMAERALLEEIGGFDEDLPFGEFHDLCLRLALASPAVAVREPLCSVRVHSEHYSADHAASLRSWIRLYEKYARLAPLAELRAHSARMRAMTAARLAAHHGRMGATHDALAVTRSALPFSWRYPQWWWRSMKTFARPAIRWRR